MKMCWSQSILTFYLPLRMTRSETVKPVAAVCVWRASDVRVCECESANMRHVNWHGNSSFDSDLIVMKPHCAKPIASLQQWLTARQFHCMVLWMIMVALTPIDSATSTIIERDKSVKTGRPAPVLRCKRWTNVLLLDSSRTPICCEACFCFWG